MIEHFLLSNISYINMQIIIIICILIYTHWNNYVKKKIKKINNFYDHNATKLFLNFFSIVISNNINRLKNMFGANHSKLKTNLKLAIQRLKLLERKKSENAQKCT